MVSASKQEKIKTSEIEVLSDREHVILRPQIYIGDTTTKIIKDWCFSKDKDDYIFTVKDVPHNEGFFKLYSEIIDNALDEFTKTNGKFGDQINITVKDRNHIIVTDNGRGVPTTFHKQFKDKTQFEVAFTFLKAGSNFKKGTADSESDVNTGLNGVGVSLVNILSKRFVVETEDSNGRYLLTCSDNMEKVKCEKLKRSGSTGTTVEAIIDMSHFENEELITKEDVKVWAYKRIIELNTYYPDIKFYFNNKKIKIDLHECINQDHYRTRNGNKQITISFKNEPAETDMSYVNGLNTYDGGSHLTYVQDGIFSRLKKKLEKKFKPDHELKEVDLQKRIFILMSMNGFPNAKFSTQNKTKLINGKNQIQDYIPPAFLDKVVNNFFDKFEDRLKDMVEDIEMSIVGKLIKKEKRSKLFIPKLIDANTKDRSKAILFISEGLSAAQMFLRSRDKSLHASFPLRGKILNVYSKNIKKVLDNLEIRQLLQVIGLEIGKKAQKLNYGKICILTDADPDGDDITSLLCVLFYKYWPELFEQDIIYKVHAPLIVATKGKEKRVYYAIPDFKKDLEYINNNGMNTSYYKGLGKMNEGDYRDMLNNPVESLITFNDAKKIDSVFEVLFGDDTEKRKQWLQGETIL